MWSLTGFIWAVVVVLQATSPSVPSYSQICNLKTYCLPPEFSSAVSKLWLIRLQQFQAIVAGVDYIIMSSVQQWIFMYLNIMYLNMSVYITLGHGIAPYHLQGISPRLLAWLLAPN